MLDFLQPLFWLWAAHCVGDFPLQGDFLAQGKRNNLYLLFVHAVIWTACVGVVMSLFNLWAPWKLPMLLLGHMAVDWLKIRLGQPGLGRAFYVDQLAHLVQLTLVLL